MQASRWKVDPWFPQDPTKHVKLAAGRQLSASQRWNATTVLCSAALASNPLLPEAFLPAEVIPRRLAETQQHPAAEHEAQEAGSDGDLKETDREEASPGCPGAHTLLPGTRRPLARTGLVSIPSPALAACAALGLSLPISAIGTRAPTFWNCLEAYPEEHRRVTAT